MILARSYHVLQVFSTGCTQKKKLFSSYYLSHIFTNLHNKVLLEMTEIHISMQSLKKKKNLWTLCTSRTVKVHV